MSKCKGCGAGILWIKTPAGVNAPLDVDPKKLWVELLLPDGTEGWRLVDCFTPHHATCPKVDDFRLK